MSRSGYSDREEEAGGYGYRGRGTGDWREYAPGGSWYGREDFGARQQWDEYRGDGRLPQGGEVAGARGFEDEASWTTAGPHAGKGPKGYRHSNEQITEEASQRLCRHGQVDASDIDVSCEDGVLALRGTVSDRRMKRLAEDCVESVFGVDDVVNELRVRKPSHERNDAGQGASR